MLKAAAFILTTALLSGCAGLKTEGLTWIDDHTVCDPTGACFPSTFKIERPMVIRIVKDPAALDPFKRKLKAFTLISSGPYAQSFLPADGAGWVHLHELGHVACVTKHKSDSVPVCSEQGTSQAGKWESTPAGRAALRTLAGSATPIEASHD